MKIHAAAFAVVLTLAALSSAAQDLTITNARIIGPKGAVIERGSIVVRGGRIASVSAGAPSTPAGKTTSPCKCTPSALSR